MRSRKPFSKIRVCIHFPLNLCFFRGEQKPLEETFQEEHCPCWKPRPFGPGLPSTCSMAEQPWGEKRFSSPHGVVLERFDPRRTERVWFSAAGDGSWGPEARVLLAAGTRVRWAHREALQMAEMPRAAHASPRTGFEFSEQPLKGEVLLSFPFSWDTKCDVWGSPVVFG